ncbi:MAG: DcaP family trimeric outer membrane transporter [Holophaga sp.]|nr:DcaP family trimeric outer membrane transporter [Holophaga sp.]
MISHRISGAALAAVLVAFPSAADEKVTPNYISLPGTDTKLKIYGVAWINSWYYFNQNLGDASTLIAGQANPLDAHATPDGQYGMTARYSRLGFTTTTPSARLGDITTLVEMDFTKDQGKNGGFSLRHAYVAFGNWTVGYTWSNWLDLDANPETVDMNGPVGQACNGSSRFTQVRYRVPMTQRSSLAFSVEQNRMGWSKFPSDVVRPTDTPATTLPDARYPTPTAAYTFADDWGHLALRAMGQNYGVYAPGTASAAGFRSSRWGGGVQLSGTVKLGQDKLVGSVYTGRGLGEYGVGIQAMRFVPTGQEELLLFRNYGWQAGYTHAWTSQVRSNLVVSGMGYSNDAAVQPACIRNSMNYFANTYVKLTRNVELGMEYGYENLHTFGANAVTTHGGTLSDHNRSNKLQMSLTATF